MIFRTPVWEKGVNLPYPTRNCDRALRCELPGCWDLHTLTLYQHRLPCGCVVCIDIATADAEVRAFSYFLYVLAWRSHAYDRLETGHIYDWWDDWWCYHIRCRPTYDCVKSIARSVMAGHDWSRDLSSEVRMMMLSDDLIIIIIKRNI